jgi:hypothetical protein
MNTARIVVLTFSVGAVGVAACPAGGADSSGISAAEPAAHLPGRARRNSDPLLLALNRITDLNMIQSSAHDHQAYRRGDSINVTTQK